MVSMVLAATLLSACAGGKHGANENRYGCDGGASLDVAFDDSARVAIVRLPNTAAMVLPKTPGGPPERYSDGSLTVERGALSLSVLRNEQPILLNCRAKG